MVNNTVTLHESKEDYRATAINMDTVRFVLSLIVTPSCAVAGAITNVFNIVVFAAEGLSKGNNSTLFILSVVDFMGSMFTTFAFSDYYYYEQTTRESYMYRWMLRMWYPPLYALQQASLLLSAKVVVGRYIVIKWPFLYRRLQISMKLSVAADISIALIGCTTIIWLLGYRPRVIVLPASNNNTDSDGTVTIQDVQSHAEERYGFENKYRLEEKIAWFYVSDSVRLVALVVVSACGADMVAELRKHSARLYRIVGSDVTEGVPVSTGSVGSTVTSTTNSSIKHGNAQKDLPNFLMIAERRTTRVALGTAVLFMASMAVTLVHVVYSVYCTFFYNCRKNSSSLQGDLSYIFIQLHGFSFPLIYTFSFFLYYTMNKRFKIRFLRIFCRGLFDSKFTE